MISNLIEEANVSNQIEKIRMTKQDKLKRATNISMCK